MKEVGSSPLLPDDVRTLAVPPFRPLNASRFLLYLHRWCPIKPADISHVLKLATTTLSSAYGFTCADVSARSLPASGSMALLNSGVDTDIIGRWRSDEILRYFHVQAEPLMQGHSSLMLTSGDYTLHPNSAVPLY
jgi:hypothetical protein